ncbi:MAG: glycerol-3-phosphate 1-O-acyltransferase PlsY [Mariprofundaceae bacterium]|nr:glycerol-3-phosphate 1-O-acyltransferase PlsY [Mariprofundaceae bacterium]
MIDFLATSTFWLWCIGAYLLGSIPFGLLFSKALSNKDPREHGSGNIGATNALRTAGKTVGILTLLADVGKGALVVALAERHGDEILLVCVALAAFVGHIFPVYLKFRGGKGVATMFGVLLPWLPWISVTAFAAWLIVLFTTRYVAVASIVAAALVPVLVFFSHTGGRATLLAALILAALVIIRHISNIQRLLRHEEPTIGKK